MQVRYDKNLLLRGRMRKKLVVSGLVVILLILGLIIAWPFLIDKAIKSQGKAIIDRFQYQLLKDGKLHVITVGTGTPIANPGRAQSCVAVIADGVFFMIDAGAGAAQQADLIGLPLSELQIVFLTHLHSDHMADLPLVASKGWRFGREIPLHIYGPIGTEAMMDALNRAHRPDREYRYANIKDFAAPLEIAEPIGHDLETPESTEKKLVYQFENGLKVYMFAVEHAPVEPAFGFRIEYKGRVIVISGDTKASENMVRHSQGADLLIHEAFNKNLVNRVLALTADDPSVISKKSARISQKLGKQVQKYHTSPVEAANIAARAGVKKLVLTHIDPPLGPLIPRHLVTQAFFLKGISDVYDREVVIAEDGMSFEFELK